MNLPALDQILYSFMTYPKMLKYNRSRFCLFGDIIVSLIFKFNFKTSWVFVTEVIIKSLLQPFYLGDKTSMQGRSFLYVVLKYVIPQAVNLSVHRVEFQMKIDGYSMLILGGTDKIHLSKANVEPDTVASLILSLFNVLLSPVLFRSEVFSFSEDLKSVFLTTVSFHATENITQYNTKTTVFTF